MAAAPTLISFAGRSEPLSADGLASAADALSIKAPEIWSVLTVETSACGFLNDRRPQILYERHIFHRLTHGQFDDGDISDPTQGGYGAGGAHQYDRLNRAIAKNRTAALQSASWGVGQLMGENCAVCGFDDVEAMVARMSESEDAQLAGFVCFLKSNKLDRALQAHDWTTFARGYNGPTFAKNNYDTNLRGEFQKYSTGSLPDVALRAAQLLLTYLGFHPGPVDGQPGPRTRAALSEFQKQQGLNESGDVDDETTQRLRQVALA